ncbi:HNH endonuclease signature motif containing protein [Cryobacterium gelidum]|uniref:HNH endonuclease n=1 Tax=Cryobacterium gelidum TaxID=1259164 RepID=A0A4R9B0U3_9MICO|nr:HNH endonuclease signature motif containing protein [Cryobacterium gelidum]TFD73749.1 HNH endonuclease [Cryobacterium gelidum]
MDTLFDTYLSARSTTPRFLPTELLNGEPDADTQARIDAGESISNAEPFSADPFTGDARFDGDRRTGGEKRADILRTIFESAARDPHTPTMGGAAPTVTVHINAVDLERGRGVGWIDGIDAPLSFRRVSELICAGGYQQVLLGDDGNVLYLGNTIRCFTPKQRAAIAARDEGCIIPGCTIPARWCEVHHVTPWQQNGPTNIDNGTLLCWYHHHTIDTSGWKIRMVNGRPQIRGPLLWDPTQTWRPARTHRANTPSPEPPWRTQASRGESV